MTQNDTSDKNSFEEPPIILRLSALYETAHKKVRAFPKHERYSMGEKIETGIIECLEFAMSANIATRYDKERYLVRLGAKLDILKILFRLSFNLAFIAFTDYVDAEKRLLELGKMAGGWIRYARAHT